MKKIVPDPPTSTPHDAAECTSQLLDRGQLRKYFYIISLKINEIKIFINKRKKFVYYNYNENLFRKIFMHSLYQIY